MIALPSMRRLARGAMLALSFGLWLAATYCFLFRPDACAAVTFFPPWLWALPGLLLAVLGRGRPRWRFLVLLLLWIGFVLAFAEEPWSLMRRGPWPDPEWQAARKEGRALRVISLNCAAGNADAALEVARYHPDIVLFQESPSREAVEAVARRLFGDDAGGVWGFDTSTIARGEVRRSRMPPWLSVRLTRARVRLTSGIEAEVMCTRMMSTPVRFDLWHRNCWREYALNRQARREHMRQLADQIKLVPETTPLIVGGDFNAPAGDAIFRLLKPRLRDAFREAGRGWGNTAIDRTPVARIDQIWVNDHFRAAAVVARKVRHSDHRMVICDLVVSE